jgi:hypothetical protein
MPATRVVTTPEALASVSLPDQAILLRTSPDEALAIGVGPGGVELSDPHAIVVADTGWHGTWITPEQTERLLAAGAEWAPPETRPALAQGMLLQLPVKLWLERDRTLLLVAHTLAKDLTHRIGGLV